MRNRGDGSFIFGLVVIFLIIRFFLRAFRKS